MPRVTIPQAQPLEAGLVKCPTCGEILAPGSYPQHYIQQHVPTPQVSARRPGRLQCP